MLSSGLRSYCPGAQRCPEGLRSPIRGLCALFDTFQVLPAVNSEFVQGRERSAYSDVCVELGDVPVFPHSHEEFVLLRGPRAPLADQDREHAFENEHLDQEFEVLAPMLYRTSFQGPVQCFVLAGHDIVGSQPRA